MGSYMTLPIDPALAQQGARLNFDVTIGDDTFNFDFHYNAVGDYWTLTILDAAAVVLFRKKVVYGKVYEVKDADEVGVFAMSFFDPQAEETTVKASNLGAAVIGAVGILE